MSNNPYVEMEILDVLGSMKGAINGLIPGSPGTPTIHPLQGGQMTAPECACVVPTHCFRSVSQRSLNVTTRFASQRVSVVPGAPGGILTALISDPATGAVPGVDLVNDSFVFNDANVQNQRGRINDLVLLALRATVQVEVLDASALAAGNIDLCAFGKYLERMVGRNLYISLFHMADRKDPWMDKTNLGYFMRDGKFWPVPPLKWINRDPAMALSLRALDFGNDPGAGAGVPLVDSSVRTLDVKLDLDIEAIYIPDPKACGSYWPGTICPKETIGNTQWYNGGIKTARVVQGARG